MSEESYETSALNCFSEGKAYSHIDQRIIFDESLNLYDIFSGFVVGTLVNSIKADHHDGTPVYKVFQEAKYTLNDKNFIETCTSTVYTHLTTSSELSTVSVNGELQAKVVIDVSNDNSVFVYDHEKFVYGITHSAALKFLGEGALLVLARLSLFHNQVGTYKFVAAGADDHVDGTFHYEPLVNPENELDGCVIKVKSDKAGEIVGFNFMRQMECVFKLNSTARCQDLEYVKGKIWAKKKYDKYSRKPDPDPVKSRRFNDDIELISEYKSTKV